MAKATVNTAQLASQIISDAASGVFSPIYLLMGDEPFYVDKVCDALIEHALTEDERDFNQLICYGADTNASDVIGNARRYPMFAERQLVVVKEAQNLEKLEDLAIYAEDPLDTTVLVLVYRGSLDKRKALYKAISKKGTVLESMALRDYEIARWIAGYYDSRGLSINPDAAALLGESAGTDLSRIAAETDKMLKNLPEGTTKITLADVEANVGISREFSMFELTKLLSFKDRARALKVAAYIGSSAKFAIPAATAALFMHFNRILRYEALMLRGGRPSNEEVSRLLGVNPYFLREYDQAVRNYPLKSCIAAIALIRDYDFKGKGGEVGEATPAQLMMELTTKLLDV